MTAVPYWRLCYKEGWGWILVWILNVRRWGSLNKTRQRAQQACAKNSRSEYLVPRAWFAVFSFSYEAALLAWKQIYLDVNIHTSYTPRPAALETIKRPVESQNVGFPNEFWGFSLWESNRQSCCNSFQAIGHTGHRDANSLLSNHPKSSCSKMKFWSLFRQQITWGQVLFISLAGTSRNWDFNCILWSEEEKRGKKKRRHKQEKWEQLLMSMEGT